MMPAETKCIIRWVVIGAACGVAFSFVPEFCLFAVPALPGIVIGWLLAGRYVVTDSGGDLNWLIPINAAFYAFVGFFVGVYRGRRKGLVANEPRCESCQYRLHGNMSGRCPECGTRISDSTKKKLAEMDSLDKDDQS